MSKSPKPARSLSGEHQVQLHRPFAVDLERARRPRRTDIVLVRGRAGWVLRPSISFPAPRRRLPPQPVSGAQTPHSHVQSKRATSSAPTGLERADDDDVSGPAMGYERVMHTSTHPEPDIRRSEEREPGGAERDESGRPFMRPIHYDPASNAEPTLPPPTSPLLRHLYPFLPVRTKPLRDHPNTKKVQLRDIADRQRFLARYDPTCPPNIAPRVISASCFECASLQETRGLSIAVKRSHGRARVPERLYDTGPPFEAFLCRSGATGA